MSLSNNVLVYDSVWLKVLLMMPLGVGFPAM